MKTIIYSLTIAIILLVSLPALAQRRQGASRPASPAVGVRAELLKELNEIEEKFLALAQEMPQEKYTWRPAKGVRSISEVYMHIADGTCRLLRNIDFEPPASLDSDELEQITDKAKVLELMRLAFQHTRDSITKTPESQLNRGTMLLGKKTTYRGVLIFTLMHMHEHLGQSIAYARINDIVPPWTAKEEQNMSK